ncbi:unnamed protein product [Citrullus colocynthis]|uniref:Uncharacterized protein n=1 Tax=Citrullus colocynthis TaxID=252529 RepID=A0ABP0Z502_9ROSI
MDQYMIEQDMLEIAPGSPNFNQSVQLDLCWELKLLHIATTVMTLDYWMVQAMKAPSTKEGWTSLGLEFFSEGVYGAVPLCFKRVEDRRRSEWARAASLCATAGILDGSNPQIACNGLQEAAKIYISMDRAEIAAKCYIELKKYKTAAHTYLTKCGEARLEDAGDCYMLAKCYKLAAEAYSRGRCFLKFFDVCTAANLFDMALQVICSWRKHDDVNLIKKCQHIKGTWHLFLVKGSLPYHQLQNFCSMMKFVKSFDSIDGKYSFLRTLGLSEKKLLQEEELNKVVHKETRSQHEGSFSLGLQLQPKLESVLVHKETSQNETKTKDKMNVANNMLTTKGSSRGSKFQPKLKLVWKEKTSQNNTKTKDRMKVADNMSVAKGSSQGLQFQSKLEMKTVSQNDTTTRDKMKIVETLSTAKGYSQGLKCQSELMSILKETTSQNDTKTKDKMKLAAKESSQGLQFQCKLELETISQNGTTTRDNMRVAEDMSIAKGSSQGLKFQPKFKSVWKETTYQNGTNSKGNMKLADNMSTAKGSSQGLQFKSKLESKTVSQNDVMTMDKIQFQPEQESMCKEKASQNDSKIGDNLRVAPFISTTKDSSYKFQIKPKVVYAKEEIAAQDNVKIEKDAVNNVNNKAEASQKLQQCNQKLKNVQKETTSSSDSKVKKDKMKESVNLSEAGDPSQQLQTEQKQLK